jgi:glycosyltransferase involved in cell wall biosynthesis
MAMYRNKRIVVVMPAYNAEKKISGVIRRIPKFYDKLIVVDDKSPDGTLGILKKIKPRTKNMTLIMHDENKGYGGAQKTLFTAALESNADYAVLMHDDGQYRPEEMKLLLDSAIDNKSDIVLGSRILGGRMKQGGVPAYKIFGNKFLTAIENVAFGTSISEFHTGYRVYSKKAMRMMRYSELTDKYYFDSEVILQLLKKKAKITEVPISVDYKENITAANPFTYGMEIVYLILRYITKR